MMTRARRGYGNYFGPFLRELLPDGRLAKHRRDGKPTGRDVARTCGVDETLVSLWKRGDYLPGREQAIKLAELFEEPVDLVLLLAGHAPQGNPEKLFRRLQIGEQRA